MNIRRGIISVFLIPLIISSLTVQANFVVQNNSSYSTPQYDDSATSWSIKAKNMLYDRWKTPLTEKQILKELYSYQAKRALISFFSLNEREKFMTSLANTGLGSLIKHVYQSFPALILSYSLTDLESINFSHYKIKYTYPIGTKSFTVPQNTNVTFGLEADLSEIREAFEIDKLYSAIDEQFPGQGWGYGVTVAVLDSGMNISKAPALGSLMHHPNETKVIASWKMTPTEDIDDLSGHGTHIASILAGNGKYIIDGETVQTDEFGIAPDAQLVNIKVLDKTGFGKDEWLIAGFDKAIDMDVDIISASLVSITYQKIGDPMEELVYAAAQKDILIVASAGNYGPTGASSGSPAIWDYVISVGATYEMNNTTYYSARGPSPALLPAVDVLAPGRLVGGADAGTGGISYFSGTSVSAPIVSGVFALYKQLFENYSSVRLESALIETANDLNLPVTAQGVGVMDPYEGYMFLLNNEDKEIITTNPKRISPENLFYYSCVEGTNTQFNAILFSTVDTVVNVEISGNKEFVVMADNISVTSGWNHIHWNISIPYYTPFRNIHAQITLSGENTTSTRIIIRLQTRFYGGTILFDGSHDNDTENAWFDGSTYYGVHQYFGRMMKDRGFHLKYHNKGNMSLENVDILVISDPELPFSQDEIAQIAEFVNEGGSLLFLINSIRLITVSNIEDDPLLPSNYTACEDLLSEFGITIGDELNINNVPYIAKISQSQDILTGDEFIFWGVPIKFSSNANITMGEELAYINTRIGDNDYALPVALAATVNKGRIMVFGSGYPFTNLGLMPDVFDENPTVIGLSSSYEKVFALDPKNNLLVNDTIDWLISTFRPKIEASTIPNQVLLRESFTLKVKVYQSTGVQYLKNQTIDGVLLFENGTYTYLTLTLNSKTLEYEIVLKFDKYGYYTIFIPIKLQGHTPTDGRITLFCTAEMWGELSQYQTIATTLTITLIALLILLPVITIRFRKSPS